MFKLYVLCTALFFKHVEPCFLFAKSAFLRPPRTPQDATKSGMFGITKDEEGEPNQYNRNISIDKILNSKVIGRRQLFCDLGVSAVASIISAANAHSTMVPEKTARSSVCDPTVESYRKGSKQIHIVGTAHVSSLSALLSGSVVKEVQPGGVFIELDPLRLNRAFRKGKITKPIELLFFAEDNPDGGGVVTVQAATLLPQDLEKGQGGILGFLNKITLKNSIQQMYEGLEAQGITPGEEFVTAVEEGANIDSIIILGDRRMDFTLRRLAKALILYTDPKKLAEADRIITSKMKQRMPELNEWEEQKRQLSAEEFQVFVEQMKTKETSMEFMGEIRKAAPELYNALVGERDVFMGRGMNALFSSALPPSPSAPGERSLDTMVAVIGLGHVDGVGKELRSLGWSKYTPPQC